MTKISLVVEGQSSEDSHSRSMLDLADMLGKLSCELKIYVSHVDEDPELPLEMKFDSDTGHVVAKFTRARFPYVNVLL